MLREERAGMPMPGFLALVAGIQAGIYTALPAIVQSFDPAARTLTAQPAIQARVQQPDGSYIWVDLPLLLDCPVVFPSGGGVTLTFPIAKGNECLIIFACRCIDAWWQSGGYQNKQADLRMHDLSDGIAIVGLSSKPQVISGISTTKAQLRNDAGTTYVEVDPAGNVKAAASGNIDAVAGGNVTVIAGGNISAVATGAANITAPTITLTGNVIINGTLSQNGGGASTFSGVINGTGNITTTADVVAGGKSLKTHVHSGVTTGGGNTGAPV